MSAETARSSLVRRMLGRLTMSADELQDDEIRHDLLREGGTPAVLLAERQIATVCGAVRSTTLRPKGDVAALVVELYDGSRPVNLVWLGRREIAGICPGARLRATGRVTRHRGDLTIFNPAYEILPPTS